MQITDSSHLSKTELRGLHAEFARTPSPNLRAALVTQYAALARNLARRFGGRGQEQQDLDQVAMLGLLKAIDRFDPAREIAFTTFATPTIVGELKRYLRDFGWMIRPPRGAQERYLAVARAVDDLRMELGRAPTIGELSSHTGLDEDQVIEATDAGNARTVASLQRPFDDGDDSLGDSLGAPDEHLLDVDDRLTVLSLLAHLTKQERRILHLRFFEELTPAAIARLLGTNQMAISRSLTRSLQRMRCAANPLSVAADDGHR